MLDLSNLTNIMWLSRFGSEFLKETVQWHLMWMRKPRPKPHEARFSTAVHYFTYAFTLDPKTDIDVIAARLLKVGIAETAIAPSVGEIRVSEKFAALIDTRRHAQALKSLHEINESGQWRRLMLWVLRNPRFATSIFVSYFGSLLLGQKETAESGRVNTSEVVDDTLRMIDDSMLRMQSVIAALAAQDRELYDSAYLHGTPFVRLELRPFTFTIDPKRIDVGHSSFSDEALVTLLIHRSGVALLMIALPLSGEISAADLVELSLGSVPSFSKVTMSQEILDWSAKREGRNANDFPGDWEPDTSRATRWKNVSWGEGVSVEGVFNLYALAARHVLRSTSESGDFLCFNSLFIDELSCCNDRSTWLGQHSAELAGLTGRFAPTTRTHKAVVESPLAKDWSYTDETSVYLHTGNAVRVRWNWSKRGHESTIDHFWLLSIVDNYLLQYLQMEQLQAGLDLPEGVKAISQSQARIAIGLSEYRDSRISYVNARKMVAHLAESNDLDRSYQFALDRISSLHTMIESRRAIRAIRRDTLLTGLGSLAAVCFALPAINQSLTLAVKLPDTPINPLAGYKGSVDELSWLIYLVVLGLLIALIILLAARRSFLTMRKLKFRRPVRQFGISWPPEGGTTLDEGASHD